MFRSRALAIVSGELANPGVALAKGDMEGMALCLPNLTLLLHMLLRIPTMLILVFWVCCFFFFPETDHWGKDKFRKNSKTLSNSQIGA